MRFSLIISLLILALGQPARAATEQAIFAGGCFWCMESAYQEMTGVVDVVSGFTGGELPNPTYKGDHSGHYEAVLVTYDPALISYQDLLDHYWVNVDPFDGGGQFCDRGASYRAAIFVAGEQQRELAESSRSGVVERFPGQAVVTEILAANRFWPVEDYHQDYYLKNPVRYKYYRWNCGRDQRLEQVWGQSAQGH